MNKKSTKKQKEQNNDKKTSKQKSSSKNKKKKSNKTGDINNCSINEIDNEIKKLERQIKDKKNVAKKEHKKTIIKDVDDEKERVENAKKDLVKLFLDSKKNKSQSGSDEKMTIHFEELDIRKNINEANNPETFFGESYEIDKLVINISSDDHTESECYNNYMVQLEHSIKDLSELDISNISMPMCDKNNIDDKNKLTIKINNDEHEIFVEPDYYNRYELVDVLNEGFNMHELNIKCTLNENDNIVFESNTVFELKNGDNSILGCMGFTKNNYFGNNKYESDNSINIGDNIYYLVIENLSSDPMFYINSDDNIQKRMIQQSLNMDIDYLIIKFYRTKKDVINNTKEYSHFFESKHTIEFEYKQNIKTQHYQNI